jgi:hypothetical protein
MVVFGKYRVCLFDLITDGKTGKLDGNKIWQHVCYIILSKAMLTTPPTWELIAAYGSVVGGSRVAMAFLKYKYRDVQPRNDLEGQ